jgi:hypothetical protein
VGSGEGVRSAKPLAPFTGEPSCLMDVSVQGKQRLSSPYETFDRDATHMHIKGCVIYFLSV